MLIGYVGILEYVAETTWLGDRPYSGTTDSDKD